VVGPLLFQTSDADPLAFGLPPPVLFGIRAAAAASFRRAAAARVDRSSRCGE
jgi:hypothetical protein